MEKYLRPSEVARLLKLNIETVYHYIKKGDFPAAKLGRKYIITEKDLERFIQRRKEAHRVQKLELSEKGKEMVKKARETADRVLDFIMEFPGATEKELEEALELEEKAINRALRRLESQGQVHREGGPDQAEGSEVLWYAGTEESEHTQGLAPIKLPLNRKGARDMIGNRAAFVSTETPARGSENERFFVGSLLRAHIGIFILVNAFLVVAWILSGVS